jgi:iron complex outermembrane recepter protein
VQITDFAHAGSTLLENAASAKAYGLESSLAVRLTTELTITGSVALAHTEYTSFPNFAAVDQETLAAVTINATGNQLQRAPKIVASLGPDYTTHLPGGGTLEANAGVYYNGGYYWSADNNFKQEPYTLVNASLAYTFPGDHWTVRAWGKNLGNKLYETGVEQIAEFGIYVQDAPPRMYGLNLTFASK